MKYIITMRDGKVYEFEGQPWIWRYLETYMGDEEMAGTVSCGPDVIVRVQDISHAQVIREDAA